MLQNRGFGFRLQRGHPNCIAGGKRPMHTIIPGMLMKDGRAVMPFGVMGGHYQPMGQSWFLTNFLEYGLDIQQSIDLFRMFPNRRKVAGGTRCARRFGRASWPRWAMFRRLAERPHGGGQAIWIDHERGCLIAASEPRKDGLALGY